MKKKKKFKKLALPAQTSFGGSLDFGSSIASSSYSSLSTDDLPQPAGNFIWKVDFVNRSRTVSDKDLISGISALQNQVNDDFLPAWSIGSNLFISDQPRGNATIYIMDTTSDDILGYHDISQSQIPVGFVYAKTAKEFGDSWQFTASHELLELLVDPYVNLAAEGMFVGSPAFFAYECCDPVEGDGGYEINGIRVSNFVYPSWFIDQTSDKYDHLDTLDAPFTISEGGTLTYFRTIGDWQDVTSNFLLPKIHGKFTRRYKRRKRTNNNYGKGHRPIVPHPHSRD